MVNISITNACNRRCAYCFQKDWYLSKKANTFTDESVRIMDLNEFGKLCDWNTNKSNIKIMGGEPLLHPQIEDVINISLKTHLKLTVISNISIDELRFTKIIYSIINEGNAARVHFFVNMDYPENQQKIFLKNFRSLVVSGVSFSLSTTLLPSELKIKESLSRLRSLVKICEEEGRCINDIPLRLAPYCPNPSEQFVADQFDYSDHIYNYIIEGANLGVLKYGFDCSINLCELSEEMLEILREAGVNIKTEQCNPEDFPFDILADGSAIWCSSANFLKLNHWSEYVDDNHARRALGQLYYQWWKKNGLYSKCLSCSKFNPGLCHGLCIAKTYMMKKAIENALDAAI